ncbi:glutamate--cysteine ligase [Candidatus Cyanaurora vandensis]|uniref:glutamate--cysteine ligase n=1 Tax=Candidatus Cyanaurora vandensis TaxID=2714958 RepID=UPI00257ED3FD|nr:glutamate--cysteine ligase [Candidatus Cyanaurora vandensis]
MSLLKGFEVEMYTGTPAGTAVGLSRQIVENLPGFVREPDQRNVEYVTPPLVSYPELLCALLRPRRQLRTYLQTQGDYTILPGSTLALGGSDYFDRSDPHNPYHDRIAAEYGTRVVTTSIHINFGLDTPEQILLATRLLRLEAPLVLALSASSPFFNGNVTGYHSTRWGLFPQTPERVPLFTSHAHYCTWVEEQLQLGTMWNVRHLWTSVRPNGNNRPYDINRAELRISDLVSDPCVLLGIAALLEHRLLGLIAGQVPDPLTASPFTPEELVDLTYINEQQVSRHSLDAQLIHWQTGATLTARDWVQSWLEAAQTSDLPGIAPHLRAITQVLQQGNEAMRWLGQYRLGLPIETVLQQATQQMAEREAALLIHCLEPCH